MGGTGNSLAARRLFEAQIQGVPKRRKQSKHPLHHKKVQFLGNSEVHSDQNLGTFDYLHQGSKIFHFKFHLNTLLFQ